MAKDKIVVTGNAGFIGGVLTEDLLRTYPEREIIGIDRRDCKLTNNKFTHFRTDINHWLPDIFDVDTVIHLAALPSVRDSDFQIEQVISDNILATQKIINKCIEEWKPRRLIIASSSSVYDGRENIVLHEDDDDKIRPLSPYALSKLTVEHMVKMYLNNGRLKGITPALMRIFTCYGPHQRDELAIQAIIDSILKDKQFTLYGNGNQKRDFCVTGDTLILMKNLTWKKIKDIQIGEEIVSFNEKPINKKRKYKISKIKNKSSYISNDVYEIKTKYGNIKATGNHPWLTKHSRFTITNDLRLNSKLRFIFTPINYEYNDKYKIGYLLGAFNGDGSIRKYSYDDDIYRVCLAVTDKEFRDRTDEYLRYFGIMGILSTKQPKYVKSKLEYVVLSCKGKDYNKINELFYLNTDFKNEDFCRGYLAGIYDAEGEYHRNQMRISNKSKAIIDLITKSLRKLKFKFSLTLRKNEIMYITILGGLKEHCRFLSVMQPSIHRKYPNMDIKEVKTYSSDIISIDKFNDVEVFNLEVEDTHTYIANGFLCHNTYVDDVCNAIKSLMDTERLYNVIYNVGTGNNISINEIISKVSEILNKPILIKYEPFTIYDTMYTKAGTERIYKDTHWKSEMDFDVGLKNQITYQKSLL